MAPLLNHLLSLTLVVPLAGAGAILLVARSGNPARARWLALGSTVAAFLCTAPLWFLYDPDGKTWQFAERFNWAAPIGASLYLGVDGTSILFLLLASLIALVAVLASWREITTRVREFYAVLLFAEAGLFGVFMTLDLLVFFVSWQITLVTLHVLMRRWGGGASPRSSARFLFSALALSVLMFAGMVALYLTNPGGSSAYSSDIALLHTRALPPLLQTWVFVAFILAFGGTMSLFPFHRWMVDAQAAAPTAVSILLAAVLTKMGSYAVFRLLLPVVPDASRQFAPVVAWVAIAGMLYGAFLAWRQQDFQRLLACATVSQMAVMMFGLFALTPAGVGGSVVHQFGHGFWIAGLFVWAAIVSDRPGAREIPSVSGMRKAKLGPATLLYAITLAGMALSGLLGFVNAGYPRP
ncbi:MAG: NADH-quinone oxidoreductase subunit M, partial [Vicinamibacterales bacterium]